MGSQYQVDRGEDYVLGEAIEAIREEGGGTVVLDLVTWFVDAHLLRILDSLAPSKSKSGTILAVR